MGSWWDISEGKFTKMLILYVIIKMLFEIKSGVIDMSLKQRKKEVACLKIWLSFDCLFNSKTSLSKRMTTYWQERSTIKRSLWDNGIRHYACLLFLIKFSNYFIHAIGQTHHRFFCGCYMCYELDVNGPRLSPSWPTHRSFFLLWEALHVTLKECKYQMARHLEKSLFNMTLNVTHFIVLLTLAATLAHAFVTYIFANQLPTVIYSHYL